MKSKSKFQFSDRAKSFRYAWQGFKALLRYEHNARIHCVAAVAVIIAGFIFHISAMEWIAITLCIGMVIAAEALNSAVEALADRITQEYDPLIGRAKDLGASAVTFLALVSVAVALIIFIPKL